MVKQLSKEASGCKDAASVGPKAYLDSILLKVKPNVAKAKEADPVQAIQEAPISDEEIMKMIAENPEMNASTFFNLIKSRGAQIVGLVAAPASAEKTEADSASANPAALIPQKKESGGFTSMSFKFLESVTAGVEGVDGTPQNAIVGFTKYKVIMLQEGMGNFGSGHWYSRGAIESAVPVFEGKKIYADHPSTSDDHNRPERTVRDILGHFENVHTEEAEDGRLNLVGEVKILPDDSYRWARSLMEHAVEFSKKYPDKEFIGLSINANGDATEMSINDLVTAGVPESTLPKLKEAQDAGIESIQFVSIIADAVSCDLVTEAGAGGKVLQLLEGVNGMGKDEKDPKDQKPDAAAAEGADKGADGHDDKAQDMELIKKMIAQHGGEDDKNAEHSEEECGMVKEAYEASKEMGMAEEEAQKQAVGHLKMMKHMASKKEAAAKDAEEKAKEAKAEEGADQPPPVKEAEEHKEAIVKLKAENAKLKESLKKIEVSSFIEEICKKSKLSNATTTAFKEAVGTPKSIDEVKKLWALFEAGLNKANKEVDGYMGLTFTPEKIVETAGRGNMFDGVFKE